MLGRWGEEFVESGGGWRLYSRVWQTQTPRPGRAAVLLTRVSGARLGGGEDTVLSLLNASAQAGTRVKGDGRVLFTLAALGDPDRTARKTRVPGLRPPADDEGDPLHPERVRMKENALLEQLKLLLASVR